MARPRGADACRAAGRRCLERPSGTLAGAATPRPLPSLAQKLETQGARHGCRLHEPHLDPVAEPERFTRALADEGVAAFFMAEIVGAELRDRYEAVGPGLVELDEQAGPVHPRDLPGEGRADPVREVARDEPVDRLALGAMARRSVAEMVSPMAARSPAEMSEERPPDPSLQAVISARWTMRSA